MDIHVYSQLIFDKWIKTEQSLYGTKTVFLSPFVENGDMHDYTHTHMNLDLQAWQRFTMNHKLKCET